MIRGSWRVPVFAGTALALMVWSGGSALAGTPVAVWDARFPGHSSGSSRSPLALRILADGSTMVVGRDSTGFSAVRYDAAGNVLTVATVFPPSNIRKVLVSPFGEVIVACQAPGNGGDIWTMKYDGLSGKAAWASPAVFNGSTNGADAPVDVALDPRGNVVMTGTTFNWDNDWVTAKYDGATGATLWGPVILGVQFRAEEPRALVVDDAGNVAVTGFMYSAVTNTAQQQSREDWATVKYDGGTGALLWGPVFMSSSPSGGNDVPAAVTVDARGHVVVTGQTLGNNSATAKYDGATGALLWGPAYTATPGTLTKALGVDVSGAAIVVAQAWSGGSFNWETYKYDGGTGARVWGPLVLPGGQYSAAFLPALSLDGSADVLLMVSTDGATTPDWLTVKYRGSDGTTLWNAAFDGPSQGWDAPGTLAVDSEGDVLVTGSVGAGRGEEWATVRYSGVDGSVVLGPLLFEGNAGGDGTARFSARDGNGNLFVGGQSWNGSDDDWAIVKYDGATGAVAWGPVVFNGAGGTQDMIKGLGVDRSGDVLVTGSMFNGSTQDWATLKYSGANAALLWGPVIVGAGGNGPVALAVDGGGNVAVTGTRFNGSNRDWATIKYSGTAGAVLWGPVAFNGPANGYDDPKALAVDGSGGVVVAGTVGVAGANSDWATIKYDGATGAVAWGPLTVGGTSGAYDEPAAIGLDPGGNVAVTGRLSNLNQSSDWATVKYSAATGATLWGPRIFNGPGSGYDAPRALAVDGDGGVVVAGQASSSYYWTTVKYAATGTVAWGPKYLSSLTGATPWAMALDPAGHPIVTGILDGQWTTQKYDGATGATSWSVAVAPTAASPFAVHVLGDGFIVSGPQQAVRFSESLTFEGRSGSLSPARACIAYAHVLTAQNGAPPYSWTVAAGTLPPGIGLDGSTGELAGSAQALGSYSFSVRVADSFGASFDRDFTLEVLPAEDLVVTATPNPVCQGTHAALSVGGAYASYLWLPGQETSATLLATPQHPRLHGAIVEDVNGCTSRGSLSLRVGPGVAQPVIVSPAIVRPASTGNPASVQDAGPGATYSWSVFNATITSGQGTRAISWTAGSAGVSSLAVAVGAPTGCGASASAQVTVNTAPLALAQSVAVGQNTPTPLTLTAQDADGDPVTFTIVALPPHGALAGTAPSLTYTPDAGYLGPDSVTFKAWDGHEFSNVALVSLTVKVALSISDVGVTEGDSGGKKAIFKVTLSSAPSASVSVSYATAAGTATAGSDYVTTSGTLIFDSLITSRSVVVTVNGDLADESDEDFFVNLSGPSPNAVVVDGQGRGVILDNDPLPSLSIGSVNVLEGNSGQKSAAFTVTLSAASGRTVSVGYATSDGTARAGSDYLAASGTLTLPAGTTQARIYVPILGDTLREQDETFFVNLGPATNATIAVARATGFIRNDDK